MGSGVKELVVAEGDYISRTLPAPRLAKIIRIVSKQIAYPIMIEDASTGEIEDISFIDLLEWRVVERND